MSWFTDIFWPTLERLSPTEKAAREAATEDNLTAIRNAAWGEDTERALREAHNLQTAEDERRRSTEGKASTYLLVIAALVPLLTYLEGTVWGQTFGTAPRWLSLLVLGFAVLNLVGASRWAFRTISVSAYHSVDGGELARLWINNDRSSALVRESLLATRRNRDAIDDKVSAIKMTHLFLRRAIYAFAILLLIQVLSYLWSVLLPFLNSAARAVVCGA